MKKHKFAIYDVSNMVYRIGMAQGRGSPAKQDSPEDTANLALASAIRSMRVPYDLFKCTHAVMCFDSRSWRHDHLKSYKESRLIEGDKHRQAVKDKISAAIADLRKFMVENTNSSVLCVPGCEADDLIHSWIDGHGESEHVIVSSDSDFMQLLTTDRVGLFNPSTGVYRSSHGVLKWDGNNVPRGKAFKELFGSKWEVVLDKDGKPEAFDPGYCLFEKIMLGDSSDNIPRAAPPRTLKKLLKEAYDHWAGAAWTDLMSAVRKDLDPQITVAEAYEAGQFLIDLTRAPEAIKAAAAAEMARETAKDPKSGLGTKFMMFCRDRDMLNLGQDAARYAPMLSARYSAA